MTKDEIIGLIEESENDCQEVFRQIDKQCEINSYKVLSSFQKNEVTESCFNETTGYGYNDLGRDTLESIYKDIFGSEDAIVRNQFISGSHALNVTFFAYKIQQQKKSSLKCFFSFSLSFFLM